mgnify:CR=1 FL=1
MEIGFGNTFFDSLKVLNRHGTWWYRIYETIRYGIPRFFKNVWKFLGTFLLSKRYFSKQTQTQKRKQNVCIYAHLIKRC